MITGGHVRVEALWARALEGDPNDESAFRAACTLAGAVGRDERWSRVAPGIVLQLVARDALQLHHWIDALRPARDSLIAPLAEALPELRAPQKRFKAARALAALAASANPRKNIGAPFRVERTGDDLLAQRSVSAQEVALNELG